MLAIQLMKQADGSFQARLGAELWLPIFCEIGVAQPGHIALNMRVPIDNRNIMFYRPRWSWQPMTDLDLQEYKHGGYTHPELRPGTWRPEANVHNDYKIDRVAQKYFTYTGIKTFPLQDISMMENQWGPLADRTREHLTSSDFILIHIRRRLLRMAKELSQGIEPSAPHHPEVYRMHREVGSGMTPEAAIEDAKEKSSRPLFTERMKVVQQVMA
jgi:hypothetical protein